MKTLIECHPAASLFPMLPDSELQKLAEDIRKNGLLEPIVLHEGMILDGRNRFAACELADLQARFVEWDKAGNSPILYVISKNLHRRQLTTSQRAAVAVESLPLLKEEARKRQVSGLKRGDAEPVPMISGERGEAREVAATQTGVGSATVWEAEQVKNRDPAEFAKVKRGETTVHRAYRKVRGAPMVRLAERLPRSKRVEQIRELSTRGYQIDQIAKELCLGPGRVSEIAIAAGIKLPPRIIRAGKVNCDRIVRETVLGAQSLVAGLDLLDGRFDELTASSLPDWILSLSESISALDRLLAGLRKGVLLEK